MHIVLTGATGLVGSAALSHILSLTPTIAAAKQISRVSILSRKPDIPLLSHSNRPTANTHTQVDVITHSDFNTYPDALLSKLKAVSADAPSSPIAVIWALGMSQNEAKSTEQYIDVTKSYALSAAKAFATAFTPQPVTFVYVSGEGATSTPGMFTPLFGKVKGETEQDLLALARDPQYANLRVYNVRPGGVDPGDSSDGQRAVDEIWDAKLKEQGDWTRRLGKVLLFPILRAGVGAGMHSPTGEVGRVLVGLGVGNGLPLSGTGIEDGGWTVRNVGLRRLAREMV